MFVDTVKHSARYTFALLGSGDSVEDYMKVGHEVRRGGAMLEEIGELIGEAGLVQSLPAGTELYRCRKGAGHATAGALGSPPAESARANRMSPAGIPMFYGAFDAETAVTEIVQEGDRVVSVAKFVTESDCWVVDLDRLPELPSLFDERRHLRPAIRFLEEFRRDVIRPIARDEKIHIEYVPTQIVTEYLRLVYRPPSGVPLAGLVYTSSRRKGMCIVLFADGDACLESEDTSLPSATDLVRLRFRESRDVPLAWRLEIDLPNGA